LEAAAEPEADVIQIVIRQLAEKQGNTVAMATGNYAIGGQYLTLVPPHSMQKIVPVYSSDRCYRSVSIMRLIHWGTVANWAWAIRFSVGVNAIHGPRNKEVSTGIQFQFTVITVLIMIRCY
jgi:hypothetical protein